MAGLLFPICLQLIQTTFNIGKTFSVFMIIDVIHLANPVLKRLLVAAGCLFRLRLCGARLWYVRTYSSC